MFDHSFWMSDAGKQLLARVAEIAEAHEHDSLRIARAAAKTITVESETLRRAIELTQLRREAEGKIPWASRGFFTRAALEQATHSEIAAHHARPFRGCRAVFEICGGAGVDTSALAHAAKRVISVELDVELSQMARLNCAAQDLTNVEFIAARAEDAMALFSECDGCFADPARRDGDKRVSDPEKYSPPLSWLMDLKVPGPQGIKISPGLNVANLPLGWVREWIGYGDECREQILWRGTDKTDGSVALFPGARTWEPSGGPCAGVTVLRDWSGLYLVEPHAALIRSGFLGEFAAQQGFEIIDPNIAYMVSRSVPSGSPWFRSFRIVEVMPLDLKAVQSRLRDLRWNSRTEIKKRGVDLDPDVVRKKLKLLDTGESADFGVLIMTRMNDQHLALLARRECV